VNANCRGASNTAVIERSLRQEVGRRRILAASAAGGTNYGDDALTHVYPLEYEGVIDP
jgi:hypothetical protein